MVSRSCRPLNVESRAHTDSRLILKLRLHCSPDMHCKRSCQHEFCMSATDMLHATRHTNYTINIHYSYIFSTFYYWKVYFKLN